MHWILIFFPEKNKLKWKFLFDLKTKTKYNAYLITINQIYLKSTIIYII